LLRVTIERDQFADIAHANRSRDTDELSIVDARARMRSDTSEEVRCELRDRFVVDWHSSRSWLHWPPQQERTPYRSASSPSLARRWTSARAAGCWPTSSPHLVTSFCPTSTARSPAQTQSRKSTCAAGTCKSTAAPRTSFRSSPASGRSCEP